MNGIEISPEIKPEIKIEKATQRELLNHLKEESQEIIHCNFTGKFGDEKIRIWKSTYLREIFKIVY